jgi:hypothetical protein
MLFFREVVQSYWNFPGAEKIIFLLWKTLLLPVPAHKKSSRFAGSL